MQLKKLSLAVLAMLAAGTAGVSLASSHREAPFITTQPKVDGADFYMFNSYEVGRSGFVTMIANYRNDFVWEVMKKNPHIRKGLERDFTIEVGSGERDRTAHHAVYAESVRNLGTPVFPRSLFDAVLDTLDADILTLRLAGEPVASVLSLYHEDAVMPYWGGGTFAARATRRCASRSARPSATA